MAVNFHQPSVYALFDTLLAPLMTFGAGGLVTYANRAAKQHPGRPLEALGTNPYVKSLVAAAILGKLKLPHSVRLELNDGHQLAGQFMPGPSGLDVAFVATPDTPLDAVAIGPALGTMKLKNIMQLLRDEIGPPMYRLQRQLLPLSGRSEVDTASHALGQRLARLADLIEVFGDDVLTTSDRIEPLELVQSACTELALRAQAMGVRFDIVEPQQALPPLYGSRKLIARAFHECLENALLYSRKESRPARPLPVQIRFMLSGAYLLVSIRNRGTSPLKVSGRDALRPFMAAQSGIEGVPRLGLPLVQRIVSLHGGQLRLSNIGEDMAQVLIEFPTGAPLRGQEQLGITQAQRYAQDLARLMSRRKKEMA
jgi:hypothetical protein